MCGPEPFVAGAVDALAALEVPSERTHLERFRPPGPAPGPDPRPGADSPARAPRSVNGLQLVLP
ncbi:hypothetical protein ADK38_06660 [Streptomyces varsoviensis]|uniref:Oxidoreductase n=1 Tax=Streptomyces varsoviensis TaxID=67373 RepID=A0ABR5JBI0_9ACTN|nr:hypothetical protein ADK38_06660 [Streptomyces varsoviensis]